MAKDFTPAEWRSIRNTLSADEDLYGLPQRRDGSIVLASFNIRKCGNPSGRTKGALDLLVRFIERCDLVAVQEVMADLRMIEDLLSRLSKAGAPWELVVSDVTGGVTGGRGMEERLAFLYRADRLNRGPVVGDISYDRTSVFRNLYRHRGDFLGAAVNFENDYQSHMASQIAKLRWELGGKVDKKGKQIPMPKGVGEPKFYAPRFLTFIRTPHMASFEVPSATGAKPYTLSVVNAHLLYGGDAKLERIERENEFNALLEWMFERVASKRTKNQNYILLGDLNLAFDEPEGDKEDKRRDDIIGRMTTMNRRLRAKRAATVVNFPFIHPRFDPRTGKTKVIRTNAREDQTFDQIGIFAKDKRLPSFKLNETVNAGRDLKPDKFDYRFFNFVGLFADAVLGAGIELTELPKSDRGKFIARFQHDVSDHMPIWIRLPMPA